MTSRALLWLAAFAAPIVFVVACEPRHPPAYVPPPVASSTPPPATTGAPSTTATTFTIPGIPTTLPAGFGLPASPRQAIVGKWNVAGVNGKSVPSAGMGTDPMDPATYVAGSGVTFTADTVTITKGGGTVYSHAYTVAAEYPPIRVVIDAGYGPSNVDFALDGSVLWSLPTTPPLALSLTRTP